MAIIIMMLFSIKVAFVIGSFKAVPKHAHWILLFCNKTFVTPMLVTPSITIVIIIVINNSILNIIKIPSITSING